MPVGIFSYRNFMYGSVYMKRFLILIIAVMFITLFIPLTIVMIMGGTIDNSAPIASPKPEETLSEPEQNIIKVYIKQEGKTVEIERENYLKGVVAAEMPVDFENEALKAQAVAARTYLITKLDDFDNGNIADVHNGAAVCTDSTHCQAWVSEESFKSNRENADEKWNKICSAIDDTSGEIMTYNGAPISAVFFSTSSGSTEDAKDVWGSDVPYLKSVKSEGDELAPNYSSEKVMSVAEFKETAEKNLNGVDWSKGLFSNIERSDAGGIKYIEIGGVRIKGTQLRQIYGLRSTNAEPVNDGENIKINVKGFGHDVGMSQYGANYLAGEGKNYQEILKRYYSGVEIEKK